MEIRQLQQTTCTCILRIIFIIPVSVSERQLLTAIAQDEIVLLPVNFERTQLLLDTPETSPQLERELNEFADSDESVTDLLKEGV